MTKKTNTTQASPAMPKRYTGIPLRQFANASDARPAMAVPIKLSRTEWPAAQRSACRWSLARPIFWTQILIRIDARVQDRKTKRRSRRIIMTKHNDDQ